MSITSVLRYSPCTAYPILPFLAAYVTGLLAGHSRPLPFGIGMMFVASALLAGIVCLFRRNRKLAALAFFLSIGGLGALNITHLLKPDFPHHHIIWWANHHPVKVEGFLCRPPELAPDATRLYVHATWVWAMDKRFPTSGTILLTIQEVNKEFLLHDHIIFSSRLRTPRNFSNPGSFDYTRWLAFQDIHVTGYLFKDDEVVRIGIHRSRSWLRDVDRFRTTVRGLIRDEVAAPSQYLLQALLLGDQKIIPEHLQEQFSYSGTAHILSISGLHIGTVAAFTYFIVRWLLSRSERLLLTSRVPQLAAGLSLVPVFLYTVIAGAGVAAQRACIMVTVCVLSLLFNRGHDLYNALALAACTILAAHPASLWNISFQLSFIAVLGILFCAPLLRSLIPQEEELLEKPARWSWQKIKYRFFLSLVISFSALLSTAPLVAYHFSYISFSGLIANLLLVPVVEAGVVPLGLLGVALTHISSALAGFLFSISGHGADVAIFLADIFADLPCSYLLIPTPTKSEVALMYIVLLSLFLWKFYQAPARLVFISLVLLAATTCWWHCRSSSSELEATFLDVGQGDAVFLRFPEGKTMLIDGGGFFHHNFDTGKNIIAPFLLRKKITRIDYLVMTHPHPDHYDGLRYIAQHFSPREFWTNGGTLDEPFFQDLLEILSQKNIPVRTITSATPSLTIDGVVIQPLSPPANFSLPLSSSDADLNNRSLVLKITYKSRCMLLAGDVQADAEQGLLEKKEILNAHLLKVPHHGSATSSSQDFLEAVDPCVAVCSVGYRNRFRFPDAGVVARYKQRGCTFLRTDRDGAVVVRTDGETMRVIYGRSQDERKELVVDCCAPAAPSIKKPSFRQMN